MSLAHELRVLELESQIELLERLQLLTNFGSNLVTVGGKAGSGKSWLAQRYLEAWVPEKNQCLLLCHPSQDDLQRRSMILSQIVPDPLFNQQDSLSDSLDRLLDGEACDVVIVIDGAHQLTEVLVSELWMLVLEAQTNPQWTINVVLFSESGNLDSLLTRLSYGQDHKPVDLEIDDLTSIEALQFFESLVIRYVDDDAEKRVRSAFKKTNPIPGELMALGELKVEKRIIIRSIIGSPATIALLVALLLVVIGGGYWWMMSQPSPQDKVEALTTSIEQTAIPTFEPSVSDAQTTSMMNQNDDASVMAETMDPSYQGADDDSSSLPPAVVGDTASVGNVEQDQQRVVITSDVVDALLEDKPQTVDTSTIEAAVEENTTIAASSEIPKAEESVAVETAVEDDVLAPTLTEQETAEKPATKITFSFARDELKALSPRGYTLQLGAMTSLEDVQSFIEKYNVENDVRIYPTLRNGTEWFIITYQDYPTIQVARDAVESLPAALRNLGPWAKSLNQVHREIDRAK
ncbi:cell division protein DamX [Vibrio sp. T187]|uniref:AAA family ATPase n=1 Tax=Vibrio TaxID=662 RepID=UPI0010C952E4|nr:MULTISPECIES: AAA family ATPase [Vibrio]MBW3697355.1 cell division protein DamX [Vibrio sp. T187]